MIEIVIVFQIGSEVPKLNSGFPLPVFTKVEGGLHDRAVTSTVRGAIDTTLIISTRTYCSVPWIRMPGGRNTFDLDSIL